MEFLYHNRRLVLRSTIHTSEIERRRFSIRKEYSVIILVLVFAIGLEHFQSEIMIEEGVIILSEDEAIENSFTTDDKQAKFVEILEHDKIKILLNKGQQSEVKRKKEQAMKLALAQYELTFGRSSNEYQIRKKIHNIKTALKKKAFGQPTVLLKPWQVKFMNILNEVEEEHCALYGDSSIDQTMIWSTFAPEIPETTPTIASVSSILNTSNDSRKHAVHQNGFMTQSHVNDLKLKQIQQLKNEGERKRQIQLQENQQQEYLDISSTKRLRLDEVDESYYEDEDEDDLKNPFELPETEDLTMEQLQRLVLVKQLNLINIQTEREKLKLKKFKETNF